MLQGSSALGEPTVSSSFIYTFQEKKGCPLEITRTKTHADVNNEYKTEYMAGM